MSAHRIEFEQEFFDQAERNCGIERRSTVVSDDPSSRVATSWNFVLAAVLFTSPPITLPWRTEMSVAAPTTWTAPIAPSAAARMSLHELDRLEDNWNDQGAPGPTHAARRNAKAVVDASIERGMPPDRVLPSVEGGVSLFWFGPERLAGNTPRRYGWIECDNTGGLCALESDRLADPPLGREFKRSEINSVLQALKTFTAQT